MRVFTVHTRPGAPPVLLAERFSFGALILGPLWLLRRAFVPALFAAAVLVLIAARIPAPAGAVLCLAVLVLLGLLGQDLRRWTLARRGYAEIAVVVARDAEAALLRLLDHRPELGRDLAPKATEGATRRRGRAT